MAHSKTNCDSFESQLWVELSRTPQTHERPLSQFPRNPSHPTIPTRAIFGNTFGRQAAWFGVEFPMLSTEPASADLPCAITRPSRHPKRLSGGQSEGLWIGLSLKPRRWWVRYRRIESDNERDQLTFRQLIAHKKSPGKSWAFGVDGGSWAITQTGLYGRPALSRH